LCVFSAASIYANNFIRRPVCKKINGANRDVNGNYVSDKGMPWAISLIHDFKVPKEKIKISDAYNFLYNGQILVEPFIMIGTKTIPATEY
jgi:hypothetical protein